MTSVFSNRRKKWRLIRHSIKLDILRVLDLLDNTNFTNTNITKKKIEDLLFEYYLTNTAHTVIKPRTLGAILTHYYKSELLEDMTITEICNMFDVSILWFRKQRKNYLEKLGVVGKATFILFNTNIVNFSSSAFANNSILGEKSFK